MAQAEPVLDEVEVKVDVDRPNVNELLVGNIVPLVAVNEAFGSGKVVTPGGETAFELNLMSAVTVELPPGGIGFGEALTPRTIHGLLSTPVPETAPQPVFPGPALQPHQLFSNVAANAPPPLAV
jgi:hypothetical protein